MKHGHAGKRPSPTYISWKMMRQRCFNWCRADFIDYGAKDILPCERWDSFESFLEDMGERPEGTTLGRIDHTKGYYRENCEWQTLAEQAEAQMLTITVDGVTKTLQEWADHLEIKYRTLIGRRYRGWGDDAFRYRRGERRQKAVVLFYEVNDVETNTQSVSHPKGGQRRKG